jgi:nucleoside-diphosphate-sugar epimerase
MIAAEHPAARAEAFIIGAHEAIATTDIAAIVARHFQVTNRVVRLPIGPFFVLGDLCELLCKPFGIEPPIHRRRVAFYSKDRSFSVEKMRHVLGYHSRYDNRKGLCEVAEWYMQKDWLRVKYRSGFCLPDTWVHLTCQGADWLALLAEAI